MKRFTIFVSALFVAVTAYSQTPSIDWSWTFPRYGTTCGLYFEDTNLTAPVKAAIRDEVCQSYSFVASSNLYSKLYLPGDSKYGTFVGLDGSMGNDGCAEGLGWWDYKLHDGIRYFHVDKELSERFLQAIALTNQHRVAVGRLSQFLQAFNSTTTSNVVPKEYLPLWWSLEQDKPLSPTFKGRWEDTPGLASKETVVQFCAQFCDEEIIVSSILNFRYGDGDSPIKGLWCETKCRKRSSSEYERGLAIIYRAGKWRVILPEF